MERATILIPSQRQFKQYSAFRKNPIFLKDQNMGKLKEDVQIGGVAKSAPYSTIIYEPQDH